MNLWAAKKRGLRALFEKINTHWPMPDSLSSSRESLDGDADDQENILQDGYEAFGEQSWWQPSWLYASLHAAPA